MNELQYKETKEKMKKMNSDILDIIIECVKTGIPASRYEMALIIVNHPKMQDLNKEYMFHAGTLFTSAMDEMLRRGLAEEETTEHAKERLKKALHEKPTS